MAYKVVRADEFEQDYEEALAYIQSKGASSAANSFMDEIGKAALLLESTPEMNHLAIEPPLAGKGLRKHYVLRYVLICRIEGDAAYLLRVLHQSQNYQGRIR